MTHLKLHSRLLTGFSFGQSQFARTFKVISSVLFQLKLVIWGSLRSAKCLLARHVLLHVRETARVSGHIEVGAQVLVTVVREYSDDVLILSKSSSLP